MWRSKVCLINGHSEEILLLKQLFRLDILHSLTYLLILIKWQEWAFLIFETLLWRVFLKPRTNLLTALCSLLVMQCYIVDYHFKGPEADFLKHFSAQSKGILHGLCFLPQLDRCGYCMWDFSTLVFLCELLSVVWSWRGSIYDSFWCQFWGCLLTLSIKSYQVLLISWWIISEYVFVWTDCC